MSLLKGSDTLREMYPKINQKFEDIEDEITDARQGQDSIGDNIQALKNDYATYLDSELGEEHIIRILPNGTKDEVRLSEGKAIINTKKHILQTSDINYLFLEQEVDVVRISLPTDCKDVVDLIQSVIYGDKKFISYISRLDVSNVGAYSLLNSQGSNFLFLTVAKGTYATLAEAQSDLAGTELIYQLAEPVEIPLPDPMTPNTREIVRLSEQVDKLTAAIIAMGGTIV